MPNTVAFTNVEVSNVQRMRVLLGETFVVTITGQGEQLAWFADNDEVLAITDDGGPVATMTADQQGHTQVQVQRGGRTVNTFLIEVYKPKADHFKVSVGKPEQK